MILEYILYFLELSDYYPYSYWRPWYTFNLLDENLEVRKFNEVISFDLIYVNK